MPQLDLESRFAHKDSVLFSEVADGVSLMDIDSGNYYHYEPVAADIWNRIDGKKTVGEICADLQEIYQVDPETCLKDTLEFLQEIDELQLISRVG